ncbi:MAG: ribosome maturation factor RimP [Actinobacteria bacterium]|nr:ribosome maturation factor RimP [Actinomycetota bacterium]
MTERLLALVAPVIAEHDVELYDLELAGGTLRLTIDRPGGVDLEAIGSVTRAVSRLIDEHDPIPGGFTLEVTSPGLERALRTPEHFAKAVGETVNLKTRAGVEGDRRLKGTIEAADDTGVTVVPEGSDEPRTLTYDQIERARTVFDWGPTPKPGTRRPSPSAEKKKAAKP